MPGSCPAHTPRVRGAQGMTAAVGDAGGSNYIPHFWDLNLDSRNLSGPESNWVAPQPLMRPPCAHFVRLDPLFWGCSYSFCLPEHWTRSQETWVQEAPLFNVPWPEGPAFAWFGPAQTAQPTWIRIQPYPAQNTIPLSVMPFRWKPPSLHRLQKLLLAPSVHSSPDSSVKIPVPLHFSMPAFSRKPFPSPKAMEEGPLPWGSEWTVVIGLFIFPPSKL